MSKHIATMIRGPSGDALNATDSKVVIAPYTTEGVAVIPLFAEPYNPFVASASPPSGTIGAYYDQAWICGSPTKIVEVLAFTFQTNNSDIATATQTLTKRSVANETFPPSSKQTAAGQRAISGVPTTSMKWWSGDPNSSEYVSEGTAIGMVWSEIAFRYVETPVRIDLHKYFGRGVILRGPNECLGFKRVLMSGAGGSVYRSKYFSFEWIEY